MERIPEPLELMLDADQAYAYATADLSRFNSALVEEFQRHFAEFRAGRALDLGCGTADISVRFANAYPTATVVGIDGSPAMLEMGRKLVHDRGLDSRIELRLEHLPLGGLGGRDEQDTEKFDAVLANSLLHHLAEPGDLWNTIRFCARPGAPVAVVDLIRPAGVDEAHALVQKYAGRGNPVVQEDFFNSLCAAYTLQDVREQLRAAGWMGIEVEALNEVQWIAWGFAA